MRLNQQEIERRNQLLDKHIELCLYHGSLRSTHDRLFKAVRKNPFCYFRAVRIGRRIITKSRKVLKEATAIYNEFKLIGK